MSFFSNRPSASKTLWLVFAVVLAWYTLSGHKYGVSIIDGTSMMPSFANKEIIFFKKASIKWGLKRFDPVIIKYNEEYLFKRIIALTGETVEIRKGIFFINGKELVDPYDFDPVMSGNYTSTPQILPKQTYFFIGDNRSESLFGKFTLRNVIGKVIF